MPRPSFTALFTVGTLAALAAPALAVTIVTRTDITPFYSLREVMSAKTGAGLPTEIYGAPSARGIPVTIVGRLHLPSRVAGGHLMPIAPEERSIYKTRLVLLFNAEHPSGLLACREPHQTGAKARNGSLNVFAALCRGKRYFSTAHLRASHVTGESDPDYPGAMMSLFVGLLPSRDAVAQDRGSGRN